jgi:hypothetical protein
MEPPFSIRAEQIQSWHDYSGPGKAEKTGSSELVAIQARSASEGGPRWRFGLVLKPLLNKLCLRNIAKLNRPEPFAGPGCLKVGNIAQSLATWRLTPAVGYEMIEEEWAVAEGARP